MNCNHIWKTILYDEHWDDSIDHIKWCECCGALWKYTTHDGRKIFVK